MRPQARKKWVKEYFLPFLIIIAAGVVFVLCLNFYRGLSERRPTNDLKLLVFEGQAKIESWGSNQWHTSARIDKLLGGDKVRTSNHAKVLLRFTEGFELRLGPDTQLNMDEIFDEKNDRRIVTSFKMGSLWLQHADAIVNMNDIKFMADAGDVLSVEESVSGTVVRVIEGAVDINVLKITDTNVAVVDTITLGGGQQAFFDETTLASFREYQRPYVEEDIEDSFLKSSWYSWNKKMTEENSAYEDLASGSLIEDSFLDLDPPAKPVVISPPNLAENEDFSFTGDELTLTGTADADTMKMQVLYSAANVEETHNLLQFKNGSGRWTYHVSVGGGNLRDGLNTYKVIALDSLGNESEPLVVKIQHGSGEAALDENAATPNARSL